MKKCLDCGASWGDTIFLYVPDEQWKEMGLSFEDYLCAHCLVDRIKGIAGYCYAAFGRGKTERITCANIDVSTKDIRCKH
jgi:hypothetical protein